MMKRLLILIGTRKGLFVLSSNHRIQWDLAGPYQAGQEINHAVFDERSGRVYAAVNDARFGSRLIWSVDFGKNWEEPAEPLKFAPEADRVLERIWHICPGSTDRPRVLYAGVAPAALFRSADEGATWQEVRSLSEHESRAQWQPGAGGMCLHSIVVDRAEPRRLHVGISAAGVFRSEDEGESWRPANRGTRAEFLPDKRPLVGQCVHKLQGGRDGGNLLFQQNHCGVYRSADGGESWEEITAGLPSDFGFPLAVHPEEPETVFVIPLQSAEFRCPPEAKLRVYRSRDGGSSWMACAQGLPEEPAYSSVYREALAMDQCHPAGVYFGTNTGKIYGSRDGGQVWHLLADHLPPVYSVSVAMLHFK